MSATGCAYQGGHKPSSTSPGPRMPRAGGAVADSADVDRERRSDERSSPEPEWRRRRRLAAVFGDVLPETTRDERDPERQEPGQTREDWLVEEVPPHHGG